MTFFCWELFGANTLRLGTNEFNTSVSVYIYMYNYVYDSIWHIYGIYIYIQYIDMALYMNTIGYMHMDVHWQWSPKRNKKVETCRCGSSQFPTTWVQDVSGTGSIQSPNGFVWNFRGNTQKPISGWWFQPLWKILDTWDDIPNIWKNNKCSKPPARHYVCFSSLSDYP